MKKSILIICTVLTTITFSSFAYMNWNNSKKCEVATCKKEVTHNNNQALIPRWENVGIFNMNGCNQRNSIDFIYNIDSRFIWNITKEQITNAKSILDIYPKDATVGMDDFSNVQVTILQNDIEISKFGDSEKLTKAQRKLLQSLDYSSNFYVRANYGKFNYVTGQSDNHIIYYITVVPEKEATYSKGQDALIDYLKTNTTKDIEIVTADKLKPGQVRFTVTKNGEISNVNLDSSSGYDSLDKKMIKLIKNLPEKWEAATNEKGEKVEQTLIFFYGLQGC